MIDLIGQRFGRLIVIERVDNDKNGRLRWLCLCDCGENIIIRYPTLWNKLNNGWPMEKALLEPV